MTRTRTARPLRRPARTGRVGSYRSSDDEMTDDDLTALRDDLRVLLADLTVDDLRLLAAELAALSDAARQERAWIASTRRAIHGMDPFTGAARA